MFNQIAGKILKFYREETLAGRSMRMLPGAIYCAIAATFNVLVSTFINHIFFPGLQISVDWSGVLIHWIIFAIAMALAGVIVGWFTENYEGIVWGGILLTVLVLLENLLAALIGGGNATLVSLSFISVIPLVGVGMLLAWVIRLVVNRHLLAKQQTKPGIRRKQIMQLTILVILIGTITGAVSIYGSSSVSTITSLNKSLQYSANDPYQKSRFPYEKVPALKDHLGMSYSLYVHSTVSSVGSMDITIRFKDGYTITCIVPLISGNEPMLLDTCNEGTNIRLP
jgi:hypothetical protein